MDLSIIIINWNTKELLRNCLYSVRAAAPACSHEIIVVDNASEDGSQAMVAQEFSNVRLLCNPRNMGFAAANNRAIRIAHGKNILLLNSDTLVKGDVLHRSFEFLQNNPHVGAMGCRVLNSDGSLQHSTSQFPSITNLTIQTLGLDRLKSAPFFQRYRMLNWQKDTIRRVDTVSGCYIMVRKECIDEVGLLDENFFFFGEETDWCKRMRNAGWDVTFAPVGEIIHFGGGSSATLNHKRDVMLTEATIRLHRKHSGSFIAAMVFLLLAAFNFSRMTFWSIRSRLYKATTAENRARHFKGVIRNIGETWPTTSKGAL